MFFWLVGGVFLLVVCAEGQRAPFDFAEGERELVRGFNVEYSSFVFAVIFLTEYGMLLFFCWVFSFLFFWGSLVSLGLGLFISGLLVVFRGRFPRFRFDLLQFFSWCVVLPFSMACLVSSFFVFWSGSLVEYLIADLKVIFFDFVFFLRVARVFFFRNKCVDFLTRCGF